MRVRERPDKRLVSHLFMNAQTAISKLEKDASQIKALDPNGAQDALEIADFIRRQEAALQSALNGFEYLNGQRNCTAYINSIKEVLCPEKSA